jgi:hypothetical protein
VVSIGCRRDLSVARVAVDVDIPIESVECWKRRADIDEGIKGRD